MRKDSTLGHGERRDIQMISFYNIPEGKVSSYSNSFIAAQILNYLL